MKYHFLITFLSIVTALGISAASELPQNVLNYVQQNYPQFLDLIQNAPEQVPQSRENVILDKMLKRTDDIVNAIANLKNKRAIYTNHTALLTFLIETLEAALKNQLEFIAAARDDSNEIPDIDDI